MPDATQPPPGHRPPPPPHKRPAVNCEHVKSTCDGLIAAGYPLELAQFLYAVTGCGKYVPPTK